jgi:formylmethanofuran dehydrogenase subunit B
MDDIPLPLRPACDSPFKGEFEVLKAIETRIRQRQLAVLIA